MSDQHVLKTWPTYFAGLRDQTKTAEVRDAEDRDFKAGDLLVLEEYVPETSDEAGYHTGNAVIRTISRVDDLRPFMNGSHPVLLSFAPEQGEIAQLRQSLVEAQAEIERLKNPIYQGALESVIVGDIEREKNSLRAENTQLKAKLGMMGEALEFAHAAAEMTYNNDKKQAFFDKYRKKYAKNGCFSQQIIIDALAGALSTTQPDIQKFRDEIRVEAVREEWERIAPVLDLAAAAYTFDKFSRARGKGLAKNSQIPPLRKHLSAMVDACPDGLMDHPSLLPNKEEV